MERCGLDASGSG